MLRAYLSYWKPMFALPRPIWILSWCALVNRVGTMVMPFLALYVTKELGFSTEQAGVLVGVYGVGALIMSPITGHLCDRFGTLELMVASLLSGAAVMFCFPFAHSYPAALLLSFLLAVTSEGFRPAAMTAVTEFTDGSDRKPAFALVRLMINLGMSVGPVVGALLVKVSFASIFYVDGVTCVLAALVLGPSLRRRSAALKSNPPAPAAAGAAKWSAVLKDKRMAYFLFALFPVSVVFFQHETTMPIFMVRDLRLDETIYGLCFTINTLFIIFTEIPLTLATNHWPQWIPMALGAALFGIGFGAMGLVSGAVGVALTVAIWSLGEMFLFPAATTYVSEIAPGNRRGLYMGMYTMGFSVAFIVAPLVGTRLLERFGGRTLWGTCLALGLISTSLFLRLRVRAAGAAAVSAPG